MHWTVATTPFLLLNTKKKLYVYLEKYNKVKYKTTSTNGKDRNYRTCLYTVRPKLFVNQLIEPRKTITHRLRTVTHETMAYLIHSYINMECAVLGCAVCSYISCVS